MKTRKIKFTTMLSATLFAAAAFVWLAPVVASSQTLLKPGEIIYGRTFTTGQQTCVTMSVWAVGQDGSNDRLLFTNALHPRISPDGRFIMFKRFVAGLCIPFTGAAEIWIREVATGRETRITDFTAPYGTFFTPETNRADNQIIFDTSGVICRINLDGTNRVCSTMGVVQSPHSHPTVRGGDYLSVVASGSTDPAIGGLYTFPYNLTNAQRIPNTTRLDRSPAWSNDGQTIAYGFDPETRGNPYFFTDLYKINPDGSNKTRLTFLNPPLGDGFSYPLIWTADNAAIFNAARINGVAGIYKIAADGSGNILGRIPTTAGNTPHWVGGIVPPYSEQQVASFGGGVTSGGNYTLVDTIGQAFAGQTSTGGSYNFESGFWAGVAAKRSAPFDFDGDGKTDISIFRPGPGEWWYQRSSDLLVPALQFGAGTDKIVPADYTGDGKTDIAFWRPSNGNWFILRSEDFSFFAFPFGANGDVPAPADFDGDGKADAAVFRPSAATWFVSRSSDGGTTIAQFGANGDQPVVADYDGDGKADIAIFRPAGANGAEWWYVKSSNSQTAALQFGASTDKAVPGDYTGDGKADIAFWRPSTGFWNILRSEDFSFFAFPFGTTGDVPSPGDYDGDGKFDATVFRPSNSTWFANRSSSTVLIQQFGITGDLPLPNAYVR